MPNIFSLIKEKLQFRFPKSIVIVGNSLIGFSYYVYIIIIWILVLIWVFCNNGHIRVSNYMYSTVGLSVKEAFVTNYSVEDFDTNYVKPEEMSNYNRIWDFADFVFKYPTEIQVMTNMAITANQSRSVCPETPLISGTLCNPNSTDCEKGLKRPHGIQTGECVLSDFPHRDEDGRWRYVNVCQIDGWCPVDRIYPPLKNYRAVINETIYATLWIKNSVIFPEFDITVDNTYNKNLSYLLKCRYNPETDPFCPVFVLGDIIKYTPNARQSYEEMAKFGAIIIINIRWNCFYNIFSHSSVENDCKPIYSFRRIDDEYIAPITGYTSYKIAFYYEYGRKRTIYRSYRIRFQVEVTAFISRYDLFHFTKNTFAYTGFLSLMLYIFVSIVKYKYRLSQFDQYIDCNDWNNSINQVEEDIDVEADASEKKSLISNQSKDVNNADKM